MMLCFEVFLQIISIVVVLFIPKVENKTDLTCDTAKHNRIHEGNLGQTGELAWLGVIRAHMLSDQKTMQIAVTGAILIKPKFAIANANDMSKIRKKGSSKAMFITSDRGIWTCKLSEVALHPEYEFVTYNTIALVTLDTESMSDAAPMLPICMPTYMYNTSNHLYAFGFTDENKLLEKVAYKVTYIDKSLCDEFYMRSGHGTGIYTPQLYECAFAENNLGNCEWENGMALASNASGSWVLVGFGVQGPGCSAPARFISIYPYLKWIKSSSALEDFDVDYPFKVKVRRADTIDSIEHLGYDINKTNYFKRGHNKLNMTFREFLKQYKYSNKTSRVYEEKQTQIVTLEKFYNKSVNDTKGFKESNRLASELGSEAKTLINKDTIESVEQLDDINMTNNYLKRDHIKFNMTFRVFLKQYKLLNNTTPVDKEKRTQHATLKNFNIKSVNDTKHFKQDNRHSGEFESEDKTAINKDAIESKEHFEDDINTTNYLKRDHMKFNMTFLEFLKQYKSSNKTTPIDQESA